ncbi:MAG: DNA polymerase III subunit delta', partial [Deltaproteobacteria bacterium]|nr:DNA polymerase III subunit delta' [Deltaproteobacteria bacterium]
MWKDVIGHSSQIEMLRAHITSGQMDHAYLFAGIQGLGKTLVAMEFFKAINCLKTPGDPCDKCPSCIKAISGNHPDLIKLGVTSGNWIKVEDVRSVLEGIALRPFEARVRVVIIEPAELMNPASSNAILKTLEEPPGATIFILISHKPSLLLPTIISRCQAIRFTPIDAQTIHEMVQKGVDPFLINLTSGSIGCLTSSDADFILEC